MTSGGPAILSVRNGLLLVPILAVAALFGYVIWDNASKNRVVVYCAHDREFAEDILQDFARRTGIRVVVEYDTEANKAVGLYENIVREASRPRCDVHWNNEIVATIRLHNQGLYEPYPTPLSSPFPAAFKSADHTWTAFAARARVLLVNTTLVAKKDRPKSILELIEPKWQGKVVMAKPQFGTTATHVACLFQAWGDDKAKDFLQKLKDNDVAVLPGNKPVAVAVGSGKFPLGLTDTDDAIAEVDAGNPVAIVFLDKDAPDDSDLGTLFIPNTVAVIKKCPNPEAARKLVDFLLSPEVEGRLAKSASKQIPLNPGVSADLPPEILTPSTARPMPVDFAKAAAVWEKAQTFATRLFAMP